MTDIVRTAIDDDDGSLMTGTVWNNLWKQELYDQIDDALHDLDADIASLGAGGAFTVATTSTLTGAQNDWAPGLSGNTYIPWNGASDAAFTGLAGGVAGQLVLVKNITTTKIATFAHQSGSSSAGNKFRNLATGAPTPVAPRGFILYQYDGTDWQLVGHDQGALITPTHAGGDYTATSGTWTVDSGDLSAMAYKLSGAQLTVWMRIVTTSVTGTPAALLRVIPGGFTAAKAGEFQGFAFDNGVAADVRRNISAGGTTLSMDKRSGTWTASTNNTSLYMTFTFEVT